MATNNVINLLDNVVDGPDNVVHTILEASARKAGVFAGEVTTQAPAHNSPTNKRKGYHYFEYGAGDVPHLSTLRDDLISWWPLNEASGYRQDVHSVNNLVDAFGVAQATGVVEASAQFVRVDDEDLLRTVPHDLFTFENDYTCVAWIYIDSLHDFGGNDNVNHQYITGIMFGSFGWGDWAMGIDPAGRAMMQVHDGNYRTIYSDPLSLATWYFLIGEYSHTDNTISITVNNGIPDTLGSILDITPNFGAGIFIIGGWSHDAPQRPFDGRLDEVACWARLLTVDEKAELYNGGNGTPYPDQALGTFPVIQGQEYSRSSVLDIIVNPPEFIVSGDRLLLICIAKGTNVYTTTPAGWTLIDGVGANDVEIAAFTKIADGNEVAFSLASASADKGVWWIRINNAGDIDVSLFETHTDSTTHIAAEITTTVSNCLAIYALCFDGGDGQPFVLSGAGWTEKEQQDYRSVGSAVVSGSFGNKDIPNAELTGDATLTSAVSDGSCTLQLSIKPA